MSPHARATSQFLGLNDQKWSTVAGRSWFWLTLTLPVQPSGVPVKKQDLLKALLGLATSPCLQMAVLRDLGRFQLSLVRFGQNCSLSNPHNHHWTWKHAFFSNMNTSLRKSLATPSFLDLMLVQLRTGQLWSWTFRAACTIVGTEHEGRAQASPGQHSPRTEPLRGPCRLSWRRSRGLWPAPGLSPQDPLSVVWPVLTCPRGSARVCSYRQDHPLDVTEPPQA